MKIEGVYDTEKWWGDVTVDGTVLSPARSQKVYNHSPDGFAWGYGGSGPAQLSLAILLEAGVPEYKAVELHHAFKNEFIARLLRDSFSIEVDVKGWVAQHGG